MMNPTSYVVYVPGLGDVLVIKTLGKDWYIKTPEQEVLGGPYATESDARVDMYLWASKGY